MGSIHVPHIGIQFKSIHPAPKIAHLRSLYEASMTARSSIDVISKRLFMRLTKIDNHKNDGK